MIKFFRKIRQQLLVDHKIGKYLLYAAGEIILVVIGILIALSFNNWNEHRKDDITETKALNDLLQEFKLNKLIFEEHYAIKQHHELKHREFIQSIGNQETIDTATNLFRPNLSRKTFDPSMGIVNSIMNSDKLDKLKNDSLRYLLSNWQFLLGDYLEEEESQYQLLLNTLIPYEASLFPFKTWREDLFGKRFDRNEMDKFYRIAFMDMKYQNLIIQNHNEISAQLREGETLSKAIEQIIRFLEIELNKKQ